MALNLIIDGYNLIRQSPYLQAIEARELEAGREALLSSLAAYRQSRPGHKITVVFDGWDKGGWKESRDRQGGITIIYSGRGEKADEVIKRLLEKERNRAVVVSSDRELQDYADRVGAAWITAPQFEASHLRAGAGRSPEDEPAEEESPPRPSKKGPAHRAPKRQRQRQQRLKKL